MSGVANPKKLKQLSKAEIEAALTLSLRRWNVLVALGKPAIIMTGLVFIAYFGVFKTVEVAAGKDTNIAQSFVANINLEVIVAYSAAAALGAGWWRERRMRNKELKEKDERIARLEQERMT